jgi:phosphopantetheine adenylyltransferase
MKSFFKFLSEARSTPASEKAKKLGLTSDGSGGWKDRSGKIVARTVGGELKFSERGTSTPTTGGGQQPTQQQRQEIPQQRRPQPEEEPTVKKGGEEEGEDKGREKSGETVTLVFGRFNPPTIGHEKLLNGAQQVSGDGDLRIYPSRSVDPKKNPLDTNQKTELMKKMFPDHADNIINDEGVKTIFDALKIANEDGYSNVKIVVGSDRVAEFDNLAQKYNGDLYDFEEIDTISAGERDEDAEGVSGMSASKMRKAATENDFDTFRKGIPDTLDDNAAKQMMNTVRRAMQVTTESWALWEIAPKFDWKNLRENYVTGNIFKINQLVENLNTGLVGKIVRRGTNYLICVTEDDIMFKSWIRDLREYTEVKMDRKMRVKGKPNTLTGTTGYFKNAAAITPGFEKGDDTNLQYGAKPYKGPKTNIREFINRYKSRSL